MKQYLDLIERVISTGVRQSNRTGIDTLFIPGAMLQFDLREGFPAVTTKRLAFKAVVGELLGFLRGYDNAAQFRALGCNIWNANANEEGETPNAWLRNPNRKGEDDLGRIYGVQWRDWKSGLKMNGVSEAAIEAVLPSGGSLLIHSSEETAIVPSVDQVVNVMHSLLNDPTNRRMIINSWRPDEFDQMALPPCHVLYQFIADVKSQQLHLCMYQRSCDLGLGVPFNIASASLMLSVMAHLTGFQPATFTHFLADAHVYVNHIEGLKEQLTRTPRPSPKLIYTGPGRYDYAGKVGPHKVDVNIFDTVLPEHFSLEGYDPYPTIPLTMAV